MAGLKHATGAAVRAACRAGRLTGPTPGLAMGFVQANLVIVPKEIAFDFLLFCQRNPKPCPLAGCRRAGRPVSDRRRSGRGLADRSAGLSRMAEWRTNGRTNGHSGAMATRFCFVCHRLLVHIRKCAARKQRSGSPHRAGFECADVCDEPSVPTSGQVPGAAGRLHAADEAGTGDRGNSESARDFHERTARRSMWAIRRRLESPISIGPTLATPSRSVLVRRRCFGPVASRRSPR